MTSGIKRILGYVEINSLKTAAGLISFLNEAGNPLVIPKGWALINAITKNDGVNMTSNAGSNLATLEMVIQGLTLPSKVVTNFPGHLSGGAPFTAVNDGLAVFEGAPDASDATVEVIVNNEDIDEQAGKRLWFIGIIAQAPRNSP